MSWQFGVFLIVCAFILFGLAIFLYRMCKRREEKVQVQVQPTQPNQGAQQASPPSPPVQLDPEAEKEAFMKMAVPYDEVVAVGRARARDLTSVELEARIQEVRKALKVDCFDFQPTYHHIVGAMLDQCIYIDRDREIYPLVRIVVHREADRRLRKDLDIGPKIELTKDQRQELEARYQSLARAAEAKKGVARIEKAKATDQVPVQAGKAPILTKTVDELIQLEAEVMARRTLKLGKNDPIPPDVMEEQVKAAWQKYRKMHGLPEPEGGDQPSS